jgi:glycerophosphoryl diester phosphodiesterase
VAHGGAATNHRFNTIGAFRDAARLGADAVEFDARRTADGRVVIHHDATLVAGGPPIATMSSAEVAQRAPHVPDLEEALAACEGMWANIEVKNNPADPDWDPSDTTVRLVVASVTRLGLGDRVLVSSFNAPTVSVALEAGLDTGWLLNRGIDPFDAIATWADLRHPRALIPIESMTGGLAAEIAAAFASMDVEVGVWTVNDASEVRRLAEAGVGTIFTDDVAMTRSALSLPAIGETP